MKSLVDGLTVGPLVLLYATFLSFNLFASPNEPLPQCAITRGAWCILKGPYQIEYSPVRNEPIYSWTISEKYWRSEAGVILEGQGCKDGAADTLELIDSSSLFSWEGQTWKAATLRLKKNGQCDLQFLVPTSERAPLGMAASVISTHVAVCLRKLKCEGNIVAPYVFRSLSNGPSREPHLETE